MINNVGPKNVNKMLIDNLLAQTVGSLDKIMLSFACISLRITYEKQNYLQVSTVDYEKIDIIKVTKTCLHSLIYLTLKWCYTNILFYLGLYQYFNIFVVDCTSHKKYKTQPSFNKGSLPFDLVNTYFC